LLQDPDLEEADFVILDFSAPKSNHPRDLRVIDAHDIPRVHARHKLKCFRYLLKVIFSPKQSYSALEQLKAQRSLPRSPDRSISLTCSTAIHRIEGQGAGLEKSLAHAPARECAVVVSPSGPLGVLHAVRRDTIAKSVQRVAGVRGKGIASRTFERPVT
jgi:hypothetical protein